MVLLKSDSVLLIRRGKPPGEGHWSLPGGAQHLGETAEAAARRELLEETGLTAGRLEWLGHADSIQHDAAGRVEYHYTILDFWGHWQHGEPFDGDDASAACFVPRADLARHQLTPAALHMIGLAFARAVA